MKYSKHEIVNRQIFENAADRQTEIRKHSKNSQNCNEEIFSLFVAFNNVQTKTFLPIGILRRKLLKSAHKSASAERPNSRRIAQLNLMLL